MSQKLRMARFYLSVVTAFGLQKPKLTQTEDLLERKYSTGSMPLLTAHHTFMTLGSPCALSSTTCFIHCGVRTGSERHWASPTKWCLYLHNNFPYGVVSMFLPQASTTNVFIIVCWMSICRTMKWRKWRFPWTVAVVVNTVVVVVDSFEAPDDYHYYDYLFWLLLWLLSVLVVPEGDFGMYFVEVRCVTVYLPIRNVILVRQNNLHNRLNSQQTTIWISSVLV